MVPIVKGYSRASQPLFFDSAAPARPRAFFISSVVERFRKEGKSPAECDGAGLSHCAKSL